MSDTPDKGLSGAFGDKGTKKNQISYGHPHAREIIESAANVIRESETGRLLLKILDYKTVPIHIIKGTGESGFSPELMTIYMQAPGNMVQATNVFILNFIRALDEAAQELAGFKAPDPRKDIMAYASFIHGRNLDSITETCQVMKELTNSSHYPDLLDSLAELGLSGVYKAFIAGGTREELYEQYVVAYENKSRGSTYR